MDATTLRMIRKYEERAPANKFLMGFFQTPPENFHTSEKVKVDIRRDGRDIAIAIKDLSTGPRHNDNSKWTSKEILPAVFDEEGTVKSWELFNRQPGQDPFMDPNFVNNAMNDAFVLFEKLESKVIRAVELMCSQVLQTGKVTLTDANGDSMYEVDFQAKDSLFPTVDVTWDTDGSTGDPMGDLGDLADKVRQFGMGYPRMLVFGKSAWRRFIANNEVKEQLDNRRYEVGRVQPSRRGNGASFRGTIWIDNHEFEMWMYADSFTDPATGDDTPYVSDNNVIMLSEDGRLDLTFGAIPLIREPESVATRFLPPRISIAGRGTDITTNAWISPDNKRLMVSAGTRPVPIPTAIDTFGTLTVVAA